jgi:hypothetical protein
MQSNDAKVNDPGSSARTCESPGERLGEWPVEGDLVIPIETLPDSLRQSMGAEWRLREKNKKSKEEMDEKEVGLFSNSSDDVPSANSDGGDVFVSGPKPV